MSIIDHFVTPPPYNGNWSYNVLTYPTAAISNAEYNRKLKQASESFTFESGDWLKKTILISGENLNFILDDLEEQLNEKGIPESTRLSIESMLNTFSEAKGSIEYCFIMHFGLPFTEDKELAYQNMMKVRNGYEKRLHEMHIGTVLIKDESDILQIIEGELTGEFYIGARLNRGNLIPVNRPHIISKKQDLAIKACPDDIESDPNGNYVYINGRTVASSILIGKQNINISFQPNYGEDFLDKFSIEELINISKMENTAVIWCHVEIPISNDKHNKMFGERITQNERSKIKDKNGDMNSKHAVYNKQAGDKLEKNIKAAMKGERYVYFALIGIVLGKSKENVNAVIDNIHSKLKDSQIKSLRPKRGHLFAIRMCLPTNFVYSKFLQVVTATTSAAFLPLRKTSALDETKGPIVCRDALTKVPIRICPDLRNPDNTLLVTPTGNGKTAVSCAWAGRVVDHGEKAYMVMPKNENRNVGHTKGTDYKTFCEIKGGELVDFSVDSLIPGLLVIPFDEKLFGTKTWAYQLSADMHYDYVEYAVGAWLGKELTSGQKVSQSTRLKKLYQERGILDAKGKVINVRDWGNPNKIKWPSYPDIRKMLWDTRNPKTNIIPNASDRSLYEATAKAGDGMPYWRYLSSTKRIQTEKDLVVFDLSGLPKNLSNAYCIYLMEYINLAYLPKDPDQPLKRVYVFWDEIHDLMENEVTAPELNKGARMGRAEFVTNIFSTQDTVLPNDEFKTLKANCRNIFLFCNLNDTNVDDVMKAFNIDDIYREGLKRKGYETAYMLRDGFTRDVNLTLTKFEKKYLFGEDNSDEIHSQITVNKPVTASGFAVDHVVQNILDYEGFFNEDDVTNGALDDYGPEFKYYNLQNPFGPGSENCWIKTALIKPATKPGNQDLVGPEGQKPIEGYIHYGMGCMLLGWMLRHPWAFPGARYDHTGGPDLVWGVFDEDGKLLPCENSGCIEIEGNGSHSLIDWNGKVKRARESGYKHIIFTGDGETCKKMKTTKPPTDADYINEVAPLVFRQGKTLLRKLEDIATECVNRKPQDLTRLEAVVSITEA